MACRDDHQHDHDVPLHLRGQQDTLYQHIDTPKVRCLNESISGSASKVLAKPWSLRLDPVPFVESDADEQLLIHIP